MKPLVLLSILAGAVVASPIMVGPIALTGTGMLFSPDGASYGGENIDGTIGLTLNASGSNGVDTVSINTYFGDIELYGSGAPSDPTRNYVVLSVPNPESSCTREFLNSVIDICGISIDGITGYGTFSGIGGGDGLLQVYDSVDPYTRTLLAQAEITNTLVEVTNVVYGVTPDNWTADLVVVDPPGVPEPSSLALSAGGLVLLCFRARSKP